MRCRCGREIEQVRIELLNSDKCSMCAKNVTTSKVCGVMVWEHKTAPSIQIVSNDGFKEFKKNTNRKGQQSILRVHSPRS